MGNFYIDPTGGNDAAAWSIAAPWKTITSGATLARIAPGDVIYLKASSSPIRTRKEVLSAGFPCARGLRAVVRGTGDRLGPRSPLAAGT